MHPGPAARLQGALRSGAAASQGPPRLPSALSPRPSLNLPFTRRPRRPAQPGLGVTWPPAGRAAPPSPRHSRPQLPPPGHRTPRQASPAPPSACVEALFVVQCLLATASSLQAGGWSLGNPRGEAEGRSESDQSETSSSPSRPASSNCRESAGSFTAARGWGPLGEEKEATNQPSRPHPLPPPPPAADLVYGLERRLQCGR